MTDKICIVTTIKDSLANTLSFVNYHLNIGVCHICLFFDDPKDLAIEALSRYKDVSCFKCDNRHWKKLRRKNNLMESVFAGKNNPKKFCLEERQQLNANLALTLSRKRDYDWITHMDSDELICSRGKLKSILGKFGKNIDVLRLPTMEAVPEKLNYKNNLQEISLFKSFGVISKFYYMNKKLLQKLFPYIKKNEGGLKLKKMYFNGNAAGKSIVSTRAKIKNIGMHEPVAEKGCKLTYAFPRKILLLHFECKSFENWKNKWIKFYKNPSDIVGYKEGSNPFLENLAVAYDNGDIEEMHSLYKKVYFVPSHKRFILGLFGLLKRINLNKKLFLKDEKI